MTAEQLEELLSAASNPACEGFSLALEELMASAPSLARRVLAAEKLVDVICELGLDNKEQVWDALTAYREASK